MFVFVFFNNLSYFLLCGEVFGCGVEFIVKEVFVLVIDGLLCDYCVLDDEWGG